MQGSKDFVPFFSLYFRPTKEHAKLMCVLDAHRCFGQSFSRLKNVITNVVPRLAALKTDQQLHEAKLLMSFAADGIAALRRARCGKEPKDDEIPQSASYLHLVRHLEKSVYEET